MSTDSRLRKKVSGMQLPPLSGKGPGPNKNNRISFVDMMRTSSPQETPKHHTRLSNLKEENYERISRARRSSIIDERSRDRSDDEPLNLTDAQFKAFQEAFELFDKNGGGTIDAAELQKTLDDCGIYVNGDDLAEIMMTLDHDGNGEVDFDEFLNLMTNTDIFLEAISEGANEEMKKRLILFDALTEFLKKQALKGGNEIISYYSKKYRKVVRSYGNGNKGAHVVGHYADVARLVGLTERELYEQLKDLEYANQQESSSPYAKSFHMGLLRSVENDRRRIPPLKPYGLGGPKRKAKKKSKAKKNNRITLRIIGLDRMENVPQERQTVTMGSLTGLFRDQSACERSLGFAQMRERRKSLAAVMMKNETDLPIPHRPGWSSQRFRIINVDIRIRPGWSIVPLSEIRALKHLTRFHTNVYFTNVACEKLSSNLKFYRSLNTRKPPSESLYSRVKDCMVSYSAATTDNSVGRVGYIALDRVFHSDNHAEVKKQKLQNNITKRTYSSKHRIAAGSNFKLHEESKLPKLDEFPSTNLDVPSNIRFTC